jgi:hypothetical protein
MFARLPLHAEAIFSGFKRMMYVGLPAAQQRVQVVSV